MVCFMPTSGKGHRPLPLRHGSLLLLRLWTLELQTAPAQVTIALTTLTTQEEKQQNLLLEL